MFPVSKTRLFWRSPGAGGGWHMFQGQVAIDHKERMGQPLVNGAIGGKACYESKGEHGNGGFGGGGGGCNDGGGGGGYSGELIRFCPSKII